MPPSCRSPSSRQLESLRFLNVDALESRPASKIGRRRRCIPRHIGNSSKHLWEFLPSSALWHLGICWRHLLELTQYPLFVLSDVKLSKTWRKANSSLCRSHQRTTAGGTVVTNSSFPRRIRSSVLTRRLPLPGCLLESFAPSYEWRNLPLIITINVY